MNHKQRMLAAAHGQIADTIFFAPRIDIWFRVNRERGMLPSNITTPNPSTRSPGPRGGPCTRSTPGIRSPEKRMIT